MPFDTVDRNPTVARECRVAVMNFKMNFKMKTNWFVPSVPSISKIASSLAHLPVEVDGRVVPTPVEHLAAMFFDLCAN